MLNTWLRSFASSSTRAGCRPQATSLRSLDAAIERLEDRMLLSAASTPEVHSYEGVDWVSGGVGGIGGYSNGGGSATITAGDVHGQIIAAYVYWSGVDRVAEGGSGLYDNRTISFDGTSVTGLASADISLRAMQSGSRRSYRADVTSLIRQGQQSYELAGLAAKPGHEALGASLIIVYQDGDSTNDRNLQFQDFNYYVVEEDDRRLDWRGAAESSIYFNRDMRIQIHSSGRTLSEDDPLKVFVAPLLHNSFAVATVPPQFTGVTVDNLRNDRFEGLTDAGHGLDGNRWNIEDFDVTAAAQAAGDHGWRVFDFRLDSLNWKPESDQIGVTLIIADSSSSGPANRAPEAHDQTFRSTVRNPAGWVGIGGGNQGLVNRADYEFDQLSFELVEPPRIGSFSFSTETGYFNFAPDQGFRGAVTFKYRVWDGELYSNIATATLITVDDTPPVLPTLRFTVDKDRPFAGQLVVQDAEDDIYVFDIVRRPSVGTIALDWATGAFVYTPPAGFSGIVRFQYTTWPDYFGKKIGTVILTIRSATDDTSTPGDTHSSQGGSKTPPAVQRPVASGNSSQRSESPSPAPLKTVNPAPPHRAAKSIVDTTPPSRMDEEFQLDLVIYAGKGTTHGRSLDRANGVPQSVTVSAVILGTKEFETQSLSVDSLALHPRLESSSSSSVSSYEFRDVNGDGREDLIAVFELDWAELWDGRETAILGGFARV